MRLTAHVADKKMLGQEELRRVHGLVWVGTIKKEKYIKVWCRYI